MSEGPGALGPPAAGRLPLPDELLLLGLDAATGRRLRPTELDPGLAGAVLLDLALQRRLDVLEGKVVVLDPTPTGDAVLDALLARVVASTRPRTARHRVGSAGCAGRSASGSWRAGHCAGTRRG